MQLVPQFDTVLVAEAEAEKVTRGGILLPDTATQDKKTKRGRILAVGPGKYAEGVSDAGQRVPMDFKPGMEVLFHAYGGIEYKLDGVTCYLVPQTEILGTIKP